MQVPIPIPMQGPNPFLAMHSNPPVRKNSNCLCILLVIIVVSAIIYFIYKKWRKEPSYLFVLQADSGELKSEDDEDYTLTLNHTHVNHVIVFTDRPYRKVTYMTADQLKDLWSLGSNSFKSDPPNAVLMAKGHKAQIIVLRGITVNNETVTFDVNLTDRIGSLKNGLLENISLVVDNAGEVVDGYCARHKASLKIMIGMRDRCIARGWWPI